MNDGLTRREDALVDLAIVVTEGHLARLDAHIARSWSKRARGCKVPPGGDR